MTRPETVYSIQLLRGVAAFFVLLFHARLSLNEYGGLGDRLFVNGYIGVDIFFVISGFIIQYVTPPSMDAFTFALRRVVRVLPIYLIATMFLFLIVGDYSLRSLSSVLLRTAIFLPNANENPPFYGYAFLGAGWTLVYEMMFYAVFAAALLASRRFYRAIVCGVILAAVLIPQWLLTGSVTLHPDRVPILPHAYLGIVTNPMMLEFIIGIVLGTLYQRGAFKKIHPLVGAIGLTLGIGLAVMPSVSGHGPVNFGIPATLIVFSALCLENIVRYAAPKFSLAVGAGSYSLYLFHQPAYAAVQHHLIGTSGWQTFVLMVVAAVALTLVMYTGVERPLTRFFVRKISSKHFGLRREARQPEGL